MTVNTKTAPGRRDLRFDSYDELLSDAQKLADGEVMLVGNWTLGQIFQHLATAYNGSIDGLNFKVSWIIKVMARLLMKKKFLYGQMPSGFQIPEKNRAEFVPEDSTSIETALAALKAAVHRLQTESQRVVHPVLGELSRDEWDNWHWRHAEMHMSFAVPVTENASDREAAATGGEK